MNILLIEDNDSIIKGLKYSLEKNNYNVIIKKLYNDARNYLNKEYKLESEIDLSKTYLKKGKFKLNSFEVLDIVDYTYNKCSKDKCEEYKASVVPRTGMKIIKFSYTSDIKTNLKK